MPDILAGIDLNLLRTLHVLLAERSVTRAATRLNRSQPAVSHALNRLRIVLDDPLFVRDGVGLVPTPRALALQGPIAAAFHDLNQALCNGTRFDPKKATRTFVVACPDGLAPLVPLILEAIAVAPGITVELMLESGPGALERGAHLLIDVLPKPCAGLVMKSIGRSAGATVLRTGHPALNQDWGLPTFLAWRHVVVRNASTGPNIVRSALEAIGKRQDIGLVVPTFLLAAHVVGRSDLLFTAAEVMLTPIAEDLGLEVRPFPVKTPRVPAGAVWKVRYDDDPGHRWFRERVFDALGGQFATATI